MSDQTQTPTELETLKARAALLGITHSNNITVETLKKKIEDHLAGQKDEPAKQVNPFQDVGGEAGVTAEKVESFEEIRTRLMEDELKLVRIRIANLDPKKKDWPGEIITVANEFMGTVRKYVPFGEATDDGYHVPHCIYTYLKDRKFLQITHKRDRRTGTNETKTRWVPEFAIEVLPQLTQEELDKLANAQAAAGVFGSED